jgi:AmmeMemoRadiSam system protein B/AmmeMemoRadiSam system protein A
MRTRTATARTRFVLLLAAGALACQGLSHAGGEIREPAVAGQFYPAEPAKLQVALNAFFARAVPSRVSGVRALIVPHAGIVFSGQIAADGYSQVADPSGPPEVVVILGTNHTTPGFTGVGISPARAFRTPLGDAQVDRDVVQALLGSCSACRLDAEVHAREHSVEVQTLFVQHAFPRARIVPLVVGSDDPGFSRRFGECLARVLGDRRALIVASSDLSHYPAAADADRVDHETLEAMASLDPHQLRTVLGRDVGHVPNLSTRACGEAPVLAALWAAKALGATRGVVVSYANSGRMLVGDSGRVVGYGAVALTGGEVRPGPPPFEPYEATGEATPLTALQRQQLLELARLTLDGALSAGVLPVPRGYEARLWLHQGAFVTLTQKKSGRLRGCVGTIPPVEPLAQAVGRMAVAAAFNDTRFTPVRREELAGLSIEISALTPPRSIAGPEAIVVGKHGVVLQKGGRSAVYLPQVAPEQGWNRDQMLDHLCEKAGLPSDCWHQGTRFSVFEAQVFHEDDR